jgi:hypothetical protein
MRSVWSAPSRLPTLELSLTLVWIAHIGFDRALAYGLKYPSAFGETHLGQIGKPASL